MSARQFGNINDFLNHKPNQGGGGKFLKGWKKDGSIYVFLHCLQLPIGLWRHGMPKLVLHEDKDTREVEKHVWTENWNCHETEEVLSVQNFRDKKTGEREKFPCDCPACRLVEWGYQNVLANKLDWLDIAIVVDGADDEKENAVIRVGGLYNAFGNRNLTDDQKKAMRKAGVVQSEAWKQNAKAKLNYVFTIVNAEKPNDGVQVTTESQGLGQKVQGVINDALQSLGVEKGNPTEHPFCIQFEYKEGAPIDKMYHARRIERIACTPEIEEMLRSEPPDLTQVLAPFDMNEFRSYLEKHAKIDLPFDWLFDVPGYDPNARKADAQEREERQSEPPPPAPPPKTVTSGSGRKPKAETKPEPKPEVEMGDPCDRCAAPMAKGALKCDACGAEYEPEEESEPEPPKAAAAPKAPAQAPASGDKPKRAGVPW